MKIVKVRFFTNRNHVGGRKIFGNEIADRGNPARYRTGVVDMALTAPSRPDSGWSIVDGSLTIDQAGAGGPGAVDTTHGDVQAFLAALFAQDGAMAATGFKLMLLPGFAATFVDTLRRAAQVATAYGAREVYCFSWPANGRVSYDDYLDDQLDARDSAKSIAVALESLLETNRDRAGAPPRIELVAHSMGVYALRHAIQIVRAKRADLLRQTIFAGASLMAADDDFDALNVETKLKPLITLAQRITVYTAGNDQALTASQVVNRFSRLGMFGPKNLGKMPAHVTRVDVSAHSRTYGDVGESHFRHQYYRLAPAVIKDVRQVLADKAPGEIEPRNPHPEGAYNGKNWSVPYYLT